MILALNRISLAWAILNGVKEAKAALRVASKAAAQDFRTDIKTARDALIAVLNSTA